MARDKTYAWGFNMRRTTVGAVMAAIILAAVTPVLGQQPLRFEAEDIVVTEGAWQVNAYTDTLWNLWSTDTDAEKKWSEGIVLQSPRVMQDRDKPEDGAPALHAVVTGLPPGKYDVTLARIGRPIGVSLDGETWRRQTNETIGIFEIADGRFELWVDDRYAAITGAGSCYFDCLEFNEIIVRSLPPVNGWADERVTEKLDRGIVAMPMAENRVYVGWRLLADDPEDVAFNVYRSTAESAFKKLNDQHITATCDFVDDSPPADRPSIYAVMTVVGGIEGKGSRSAEITPSAEGQAYVSVALDGDHSFQRIGSADLNGDGRYDYVIKQPNANVDPYVKYWKPSPTTYKVEAYLSDGTFLWRKDLGWAIEQGIWYSPMIVYDLDGDGRAEVCLKTGPEDDPRDAEGKVQSGGEWVSVLDGMTGEEIARTNWPAREEFSSYNLASRNQICVAYLDGKTPCLILERGTYRTMMAVAYQLRDGQLEELWRWRDRDDGGRFRGQGAHSMHAVDIDGDGRDEVFLGSATLDDNGAGLWSTGRGHPDHHYVGDIDPTRPGLEVYYGIETRQTEGGCLMVDAATGEELWALDEATTHVHSIGMCSDIDGSRPGMECYSGERDIPEKRWLWGADGELIETTDLGGLAPRSCYWDADLQRELMRGGRIYDYKGQTHQEGIQGSLISVADILGDWREELITSVEGELRIYTTTIPAEDRRVCLMQDPLYRMDVAIQAMGYTQQPMTTNCLSAGQANLTVAAPTEPVTPGTPVTVEVALVAATSRGLSGRISVQAGEDVSVDADGFKVTLAPGEVGRYQIRATLMRAPGLLGEDVSGAISASFSGGGEKLVAAARLRALDLPAVDLPRTQAEDFSGQGGGEVQVRDDKVGDDKRSISHWDDEGHWLEWKLTAPEDGRYRIALRYSTIFDVTREASLDGKAIEGGPVKFAASGGFGSAASDWRHTASITVNLRAGEHTLRLTNVDGHGMNADYVLLTRERSRQD